METYKANTLAINLLRQHGLLSNGWVFNFDNGKRRLGCCKHRNKAISFSKHYLPLVDILEFTDTLLHEIAHALVGSGHGHDLVWKRKAVEIGCNGKRLYNGDKKVEGKYIAVCHKCGTKHYRHRMGTSNRNYSCGHCSNGRFNKEYILVYQVNK